MDECALKIHNCISRAGVSCENTIGGFTCLCHGVDCTGSCVRRGEFISNRQSYKDGCRNCTCIVSSICLFCTHSEWTTSLFRTCEVRTTNCLSLSPHRTESSPAGRQCVTVITPTWTWNAAVCAASKVSVLHQIFSTPITPHWKVLFIYAILLLLRCPFLLFFLQNQFSIIILFTFTSPRQIVW